MIPISSLIIIAAASLVGFALLGMTRYWLPSLALCAGLYVLFVLVNAAAP